MLDCYVVDTNVVIVASAADPGSPFGVESTPVRDSDLRIRVLDWLDNFGNDPSRLIVLDYGWEIMGEYGHQLGSQDFGYQVVLRKSDTQCVHYVPCLELDKNGHAILPDDLNRSVTDLEDRKMVAAALLTLESGNLCKIVNACDGDWYQCRESLQHSGIAVHEILEDWIKTRPRK